jgi:hypothetical protein
MPIDRPNAQELLNAVREHLMNNLAPTLKGQPAFHLRVATNVLATIERTMEQGEEMDAAEVERLKGLLGADGDVVELNRELVEKIRSGKLDEQSGEVLDHLRQTTVDKLNLANPKYMVSRD